MSGWASWTTRVATVACTVALIIAALSGCAPTVPEIDSAAASRMQASVYAVTQAAAAHDPARAIAGLDALEAQLKHDKASGAINADRSARIQAAIGLVRADLTAVLPTPSPTPTVQAPGQQGNNGKGKGKDDKKDKED